MTTDIGNIVSYETLFDLELRHPVTDKPTGVVWKIRSAESNEAKALARQHIDASLSLAQSGKKIDIKARERQDLERVAGFVAGWPDDMPYKGEKLPYSPEAAVRVLDETGWIYAQVVKAATELANFTKG